MGQKTRLSKEDAAEAAAQRDEITRNKVKEIERLELEKAVNAAQGTDKPKETVESSPDTQAAADAAAGGGAADAAADGDQGEGEAMKATGRRGGGGLTKGGAAGEGKQKAQQEEEQQQAAGDEGQGANPDEQQATGEGQGEEQKADVDPGLVRKLRVKCTAHSSWSNAMVEECLKKAALGLSYDAPGGREADAEAGAGSEGGEGEEEPLAKEDLDPRQRDRLATGRLQHISQLKSRVTGDLHDAGRLLGERMQRTKRAAIKGIRQSEEVVVGRLGWGGVVMWSLLLVAVLFGVPYLRSRGRSGRMRYRTDRSD